jgi:arabinose-5-phosphate isomerase
MDAPMNRPTDPARLADPAPLDGTVIAGRAREIIGREAEGMAALAGAIDGSLAEAIAVIEARVLARPEAGRPGRLVVSGVGKSGHIGAKLASTFASTGTPSFYLHAAEAAHGDLGMIGPEDVVLAISNSGDTRELFPVLDYCRTLGVPVIAITARAESRLGRQATVLLRLPTVEEVCPNNLAPTTSTLITLSLGHVIAVLLMERRSFADTDFAQFHPGGQLGHSLATVRRYVEEFGGEAPGVAPETPMSEVISAVALGRKGCVVVLDPLEGTLRGIITEGDLRRAYDPEMFGKRAMDIMTPRPVTIGLDDLVRDAIALMTERRIANIVVLDGARVVEVLDTKDLMQRGYL